MQKTTDKIEISIIIAAYNVEKYIPKTLKSLNQQTANNFEVVLVDDGSKDKTLAIIQKFQEISKFPLKLITQKNSGVSSARNRGLEEAKGDYLIFVDSDDYLDQRFVELLHQSIITNKTDLAYCGYYDVNEEGEILRAYSDKYLYLAKPLVAQEFLKMYLTHQVHLYACNFIFKKSLLLDRIKFSTNIRIAEDQEFNLKILFNAGKISSTPHNLYYYLQRKGSAMHSLRSLKYLDLLKSLNNLLKYLEKYHHNQFEKVEELINYVKLPTGVMLILKDWAILGERKKYFSMLKRRIMRTYLKRAFSAKDLGMSIKIRCFLLLFFPRVFYYFFNKRIFILFRKNKKFYQHNL